MKVDETRIYDLGWCEVCGHTVRCETDEGARLYCKHCEAECWPVDEYIRLLEGKLRRTERELSRLKGGKW